MPYELNLPAAFRKAGWKVKIREKESRKAPHVTILWRTRAWRVQLRTGAFLDRRPDPREVPRELLDFVRGEPRWSELQRAWNHMYGDNPV